MSCHLGYQALRFTSHSEWSWKVWGRGYNNSTSLSTLHHQLSTHIHIYANQPPCGAGSGERASLLEGGEEVFGLLESPSWSCGPDLGYTCRGNRWVIQLLKRKWSPRPCIILYLSMDRTTKSGCDTKMASFAELRSCWFTGKTVNLCNGSFILTLAETLERSLILIWSALLDLQPNSLQY